MAIGAAINADLLCFKRPVVPDVSGTKSSYAKTTFR
jgi:hypothetical protein